MASSSQEFAASCVVISGCSNHMMGDRSLFITLDESQKVSMWLGDNNEMMMQGEGTVYIKTQTGEQKQLQEVQFVLGLAHRLLSVGQLTSKEYFVVFSNDS